jgi:clan AA aspartic protease (TIGR02281 family)
MKIIKWLSIFLSISLGANLWFVWYISQQPKPSETNELSPSPLLSTEKNIYRDTGNTSGLVKNTSQHQRTDTDTENALEVKRAETISADEIETIKANRSDFLNYLKGLAQEQAFITLEYEVADYLRQYPQDMQALLLEAQAYYHTKPLNIALVHYIELLSLPLSAKEREEVEKLVQINTTRVIQQFSGDGAWDLLAKFLEPLVQIDPLNRQYLMPLARAYGMQSQFSLMEDALAAYPSDDQRALRLRKNVQARLNNEPSAPAPYDMPDMKDASPYDFREADVLLKQSRGHFVAQAHVHNTIANLLVDTGASTTALSDVKFSRIPVQHKEFLGLFNVNTAGGTIEAPIYKIKRFKLGKRVLANTSVLILPSENLSEYDGLLGMNVLSQFDLAFDANSNTMRMYRKR